MKIAFKIPVQVLIIVCTFLLYSCANQIFEDKKYMTSSKPSKGMDVELRPDPISLKNLGDTSIRPGIDFRTAKMIEILSMKKRSYENTSKDEYSEKCKSWSLTIEQFGRIIRKFKSMSSELQYLSYLSMPCEMNGEIKIDKVKFEYWINAGATLVLMNKDTTLYFGFSGKK